MFSVDTTPRFARFTVRTDCGRCGAHLPVNGPVPEVGCADCGHHTTVPDSLWIRLFRGVDEDFPQVKHSGRIIDGDTEWPWTAEFVQAPRCQRCDHTLDDSGSCVGCRRPHATTEVRQAIQRRARNATLSIGGADCSAPRTCSHLSPVRATN